MRTASSCAGAPRASRDMEMLLAVFAHPHPSDQIFLRAHRLLADGAGLGPRSPGSVAVRTAVHVHEAVVFSDDFL